MAIGVWQGLGVDGSMFRAGHHWEVLVFTDIESAGCVQVLEVLLERTPIGLRCWEREACGSVVPWSGTSRVWGGCLWYPSLIDSLVGLVVEIWSAGPYVVGLQVR